VLYDYHRGIPAVWRLWMLLVSLILFRYVYIGLRFHWDMHWAVLRAIDLVTVSVLGRKTRCSPAVAVCQSYIVKGQPSFLTLLI
jgi:hypothetical protein